jgi:glycosyltransferase involved in cell wall biosynthesis
VFDLPEIDRGLIARGIRAQWTIAGAGPDEAALKQQWAFNPDVRWLGGISASAVHALYESQDVSVLPTRFEGFPLALLEAMGAGVVPVVSDIPSGVPEVVSNGETGERLPIRDVGAFVAAIAALDRDRSRLDAMSVAARRTVAERFDIRDRIADYQALYIRWRALYRPLAAARRLQYGSRLDRPWMPNAIVSAVRSARRRRS